jgi:ABC-2 type transport system permease protein
MIIILLPIIEILLFGFVLSFEISNVHIAIIDEAHDSYSQDLIRSINSSKYFTTDFVSSYKQAEKLFQENKIKATVLVRSGLEKNIMNGRKPEIQILLDASDPNIASTIETYIGSMIRMFMQDKLGNTIPNNIKIEPRLLFNPLQKTVFSTVPGLIAVILMLICALMTSISVTREKETGTLRVLLISPLKPYQIIAGKLIPYIVVSFVNIILILILSFFVFGVPIRGSLIMLLLVSIIYSVCALALGLLISNKAKSQEIAMMMSQAGLMLPTTLLSGMIYPIKNMPIWLQGITAFFPARWYVDILKHIMIKGSSFSDFLPQILILCGMTLLLMVASIRSFRVRFK